MTLGNRYDSEQRSWFANATLAFFVEMQKTRGFKHSRINDDINAATERAEVYVNALTELLGEARNDYEPAETEDTDAIF